jgi:FkbM family methyltransferase
MLREKIKVVVDKLLEQFLKKINRHFKYVPPGQLTGFDLEFDLTVLIPDKEPICIDIGANKDQTIRKLKKVFKSPYIYAFEPSTEVFEELQEEFSNAKTKVFNVAVGSTKSQKEFINYEETALSSFLEIDKTQDNVFRKQKETKRETVKVKTVDSFIEEENLDICHLLKSDTQGYELEVLKGAKNSLSKGKIQNILIELNFIPMYQHQANYKEIIDFCANFGFYPINYYEIVRKNYTIAWCTALFGKR